MGQKLFVLGHPVGHSKSPAMHNAAYAALGLDWTYSLMDCETPAEAQAFVLSGGWLALNVTMPYKPLALASARHSSAAARLAGGANVLIDHGGALHADNTDGKGCVAYLRRCGLGFEGARVAVCGTGPTSLAIMHACVEAGAGRVLLLGRDGRRAAQALQAYRELAAGAGESQQGAEVRAGAYADCLADIADAQLIVDATPLGMTAGDPAPFDTAVLGEGQTVLDVVYGHGTTRFVADARAAGCKALDGAGMLVAQAVETVRDIESCTGLVEIPATLDLFAVMAQAAGFDELA